MGTSILFLLLTTAALAAKKPAPPPCITGPQVIGLATNNWVESGAFFGRSKTPSALPGGGFYLDFPTYSTDRYIGYLTTGMCGGIYGSSVLSITLAVSTTGTPVFMYDSEPFNSPANGCSTPSSVRAYFQSSGSGEFDRWWANPISYVLASGQITLNIPLIPDQWSSLYGKAGNFSTDSVAGFINAQQHTQLIGVTFGGGCFFSHGVNVLGGTAQFQMLDYRSTF